MDFRWFWRFVFYTLLVSPQNPWDVLVEGWSSRSNITWVITTWGRKLAISPVEVGSWTNIIYRILVRSTWLILFASKGTPGDVGKRLPLISNKFVLVEWPKTRYRSFIIRGFYITNYLCRDYDYIKLIILGPLLPNQYDGTVTPGVERCSLLGLVGFPRLPGMTGCGRAAWGESTSSRGERCRQLPKPDRKSVV